LTKKKVPLSLPPRITWYTCGPTVYDFSHLGHARNYVQNDIIQRVLTKYFGFEIDHVMGMTDIDDKIVTKAKEENKSAAEIAIFFEKDFFEDMSALGILNPTRIGRVTEHLQEIFQFIQQIQKNGFCYISNDSVYFDSQAFERNGYSQKLNPYSNKIDESNNPNEEDNAFANEKKNLKDFALWKKCNSDTEIGWSNPFSQKLGRPGWHIECSAVASHHLGQRIDIHSGGIDLCFPHHNNEIVQADACFGYHQGCNEEWVKYFLHIGHLYIDGRKMSKSLKNFISIKQFFKEYGTYSGTLFRFFCLQIPWNSNVDFSKDRMMDASNLVEKFKLFFNNVEQAVNNIDHFNRNIPLQIIIIRHKTS